MNRADHVVDLLKTTGGATLPQLCAALEIGRGNASRILADLLTAGRVVRTGRRRLYVYIVAPPVTHAASVFDIGALMR